MHTPTAAACKAGLVALLLSVAVSFWGGTAAAAVSHAMQPLSPALATEAPAAPTEEANLPLYIGNKNSKKFHYPSCSSVTQMKDANKVELHGRDEAIREGYDPCGRCHP